MLVQYQLAHAQSCEGRTRSLHFDRIKTMEERDKEKGSAGAVSITGRVNRVTATVLNTVQPSGLAGRAPSTVSSRILPRVLLRAVQKGTTGKSDGKLFTLRSINTGLLSSCDALKQLIKEQLSDDIASTDDFDIGFLDGSNLVRIRSTQDLAETWAMLSSNSKVTLWCDGLLLKPTRKRAMSDVDEACSSKGKKKKSQERDDKVQEIFHELKEKHSVKYTTMQLRIWAEMINSGMHVSIVDAPNTSMFNRAGGTTPSKKDQPPPVAQALADAASTIASAISPGIPVKATSTSQSPGKIIESRSKLYKQLSELRNLHSSGVLTEEQYQTEKECILGFLKEMRRVQ